jgi:hypothetical protein
MDFCNAQLTELAMKNREDQQGFNSVYMMLDSGARVQRTNSSVNWYAWFDGCLKINCWWW